MSIQYLVGDTRDRIKDIAAGSVSLVATSPPFVALRSYLPIDHPLKSAEIGTEPDPATFIGTLLELVAEWGTVLAPWGSIAVELGDTYAGGGGGWAGVHDAKAPQRQHYADTKPNPKGGNWPNAKSLALVPQAFALSLAYGRNILTGEPSPAGRWLVRNMIVWHRPNPVVGALGDKFRPSTSYITVATRSSKRWFDLSAVRTTPTVEPHLQPAAGEKHEKAQVAAGKNARTNGGSGNPAGAPPLDAWFDEHDVWTVTSQPSRLAHFAMWPPKLAERLILSMCPAEVCATCGQPRRRIEQQTADYAAFRAEMNVGHGKVTAFDAAVGNRASGLTSSSQRSAIRQTHQFVGWSDCGHHNYQPGVVLDPFAGTGTTLAVADLHGRDAIGIDIDERNSLLVEARRAEVRKTLTNAKPVAPNQPDLWSDNDTL